MRSIASRPRATKCLYHTPSDSRLTFGEIGSEKEPASMQIRRENQVRVPLPQTSANGVNEIIRKQLAREFVEHGSLHLGPSGFTFGHDPGSLSPSSSHRGAQNVR
eukprot:3996399-Pyramimonas_sp.AAC.1